jgi:hypothetical protein
LIHAIYICALKPYEAYAIAHKQIPLSIFQPPQRHFCTSLSGSAKYDNSGLYFETLISVWFQA